MFIAVAGVYEDTDKYHLCVFHLCFGAKYAIMGGAYNLAGHALGSLIEVLGRHPEDIVKDLRLFVIEEYGIIRKQLESIPPQNHGLQERLDKIQGILSGWISEPQKNKPINKAQ